MTIKILNLSLVKKVKTVPLQFTLQSLRDHVSKEI